LKVIQSNINPKFQESFNNEVEIASNLHHEYIVEYVNYEFFGSDALFLVMEFADGGTLEDELKQREKSKLLYTFDEQIRKFTNLAKAMKYLSKSIVHRDIKPSNILLKDDRLLITDFGLAKLAEENTRSMTFKGFGTIKYIAPEAWRNLENTIQMDIYSMGIVFYEIATSNYPYEIKTPFNEESFKDAHLYSTIIDPTKYNANINPKIAALLKKMLEKSLNQRFKNWDEVLSLLSFEQDGEDPLLLEPISKRNEIDIKNSLETQNRLVEEKKKQDLFSLVKYNFDNLVINPLISFIDSFNKSYPSGKISTNSK
jgi:serine/threonine protein kinase